MKNFRSLRSLFGITVLLTAAALPSLAFNPPRDTQGPFTVEIGDPGEVTALEKPIVVPVTLTNSGDAPLAGTVRVGVTDDWRVEGKTAREFSLLPKGKQTIPFAVVAGKGTYAALYPVHAHVEFRVGKSPAQRAHAILVLSVAPQSLATRDSPLVTLRAPSRGPLRLDVPRSFQVSVAVHDKPLVVKPVGWLGVDQESGCHVSLSDADRDGRRHVISVHPPYRSGWGDALADWRMALPKAKPLALEFATAIRDQGPREPASDGVEFRVLVSDGGEFKKLFSRFSAAKRWEPARVDLSDYAGREITLRLFTGPGPKHNTVCDSAFWAEPTLWIGPLPQPEPEVDRTARRAAAVRAAHAALRGETVGWAWVLANNAGACATAVVPGRNGIADAFVAFVDEKREVVFDGFVLEIDKQPLAAGKAGLICGKVEQQFAAGRGTLTHHLLQGDRSVRAQAGFWAEKGALRVVFSMPGAKRDQRGEPRFTTLMLGPASEKPRRVYAGFGNVLQDPGKFDLSANGFQLSTRHVGADFANGLSLVQASDVFPDRLRVDPEMRVCSLVAHHDATFSFVPSARGAFAAARVYRGIANFKPAPGVAKMLGRMCLDQWGGNYREAADGIEQAARYGLTDAVFVKHAWQRWGYDYRLPDIYPPVGNFEDFRAMVAACKRHGVLFAPHDNYIDFYPDAEGYSYDHIIFNPDGTPQKAWLNEGRQAQSYRWLPTAFGPWLERNLRLIKRGFAPTSYFVDVFSAMPPVDFHDRAGRFYPKTICADRWGAAFDRIRQVLGNHAPQISEAGHDALIGHLDASQADHMGWIPGQWRFAWGMEAGDVERVPWHDMASHGAFVLFAGGLGSRYTGKRGDQSLHGYASDDYLSMTVLGGRNPMCDGPFTRRTVMTYWLLHDVCAELARREMVSHEFAGDDIHRQMVKFSEGASVAANRGKTDWQIKDATLPPFGFVARAGNAEASVTRRDGLVTAMARNGQTLFVDARTPASDERRVARPLAVAAEDLGGGRFRLRFEWTVSQPVESGWQPFVHFVDEKGEKGEGIAFQGHMKLNMARLAAPGKVTCECDTTLPHDLKLPATFAVRCGLYHPGKGGSRLRLDGPLDGTGRARCGRIVVAKAVGGAMVRWEPEPADPDIAAREARLNLAGEVVDFGPVATSGAFRLRHAAGADWELTPLPASSPFRVELRLDRLGAAGRKARCVMVVGMDGRSIGEAAFRQDGATLSFSHDGKAFAYRIVLGQKIP